MVWGMGWEMVWGVGWEMVWEIVWEMAWGMWWGMWWDNEWTIGSTSDVAPAGETGGCFPLRGTARGGVGRGMADDGRLEVW